MEFPEDLRKAKLALHEAVHEADTAVRASLPSLDELEKIREAFDESLGRVAMMISAPRSAGCDLTVGRPRNLSDN